jgi:hypothetical protein
MLRSGIAESPPPDPFNIPLSMYKQTRLKSSKDLVNKHLQKGATNQGKSMNATESLYINTTRFPTKQGTPSKMTTIRQSK